MMLYIVLILVLLLIFYVLVVPLILHIDTSANQYYIQIGGITKVNFLYDEAELIKLKLKLLGFNYEVFPLRKKPKSKPKNRIKENTDKAKKKALPFKKIIRVIRSFEVKQFLLDIDTGDCITNSKLYPVFAGSNFYLGSQIFINYQGRNRFVLTIQNRPIRLLKAYMNI